MELFLHGISDHGVSFLLVTLLFVFTCFFELCRFEVRMQGPTACTVMIAPSMFGTVLVRDLFVERVILLFEVGR